MAKSIVEQVSVSEMESQQPSTTVLLQKLDLTCEQTDESQTVMGEKGTEPWPNIPHSNSSEDEPECEHCRDAKQYSFYKVADLGDNLLLGGRYPALCPYYLKGLGVTHVLRVMDDDVEYQRPPKFEGFNYLTLDIEDSGYVAEALRAEFEGAFKFISEVNKSTGVVC